MVQAHDGGGELVHREGFTVSHRKSTSGWMRNGHLLARLVWWGGVSIGLFDPL